MKGRKARATGGDVKADDDMKKKNQRYTYQSKVNDEAEERKRGGRTGMKASGEAGKQCASRMARKSGGRTGTSPIGASGNPMKFAAHAGTAPKGRKLQMN
jgi:hypothetical protein